MLKLTILIFCLFLISCSENTNINNTNNSNNTNNINNTNNTNINNTNNSNNTNNINNTNNTNNQTGYCGDNIVDNSLGEVCDATNLDSKTCETLGFSGGGDLSCSNCQFNTSQCQNLQTLDFTTLTYNVGNPDSDDPFYPLRMKSSEYLEFISITIQTMQPDIVVLQEVLSGKTCTVFTETDSMKTCYEWDTALRPARRLLGNNYTIVCDNREHVECIGIHTSFGNIPGINAGEYLENGAQTPSLPLPGCNWANGECTNDLCDDESTVSAVTVQTVAGPIIRVVHMHPMAQVSATIAGDPCRALQMRQVFENDIVSGESALVKSTDNAVIIGDWNLGLEVYPMRTLFQPSDADDIWNQYIGCSNCNYHDIDPRDSSGNRYSTNSNLSWSGQIVAIDHVVLSSNMNGDCTIYDEGGMQGTEPLDSGYSGISSLEENERIDHYAISCNIHLDIN